MSPLTPPSPQQLRIIRLMADGLSHQQIAAEMHLSETTVSEYKTKMYRKWGATCAPHLIAIAFRQGWIQ